VFLPMRRVTCALAMTATAYAAVPRGQEPTFEVASIRPSPDGPPAPGAAGVHITQQQVRFSYLSLRDYIGIAYGVPPQQISAPDWVPSARFDIAATFPTGATPEQFPLLVQALLRDRFQLQMHRESREFPVYVLEVASNGPPLVAVPDDAPLDGPFTVTSSGGPEGISADLGQGSSLTFANGRFELKKVTMTALSETLGRFMDRPILNWTKLEGRYNVGFKIAPEEVMPMMIRSAVNAGISLPPQALTLLDGASIGSVEEGLKSAGLSLAARRAPLDVVVVDSIQRAPSEN